MIPIMRCAQARSLLPAPCFPLQALFVLGLIFMLMVPRTDHRRGGA